MSATPVFDDLYVVSDLHMGGKPGFQIFKNGNRLARLLDQVATENPDREVALLVNGDIIDSLAEEQRDGYISVDQAENMLQRIFDDPAFRPVWDALARFVQTDRRYLAVTLGNHDLEMALPSVELTFRRRLAGTSDAANGRITFATHGWGYACRIGNARVYGTHGNEVDTWNVVDHEHLRRVADGVNSGQRFDPAGWTPNAGTRFVVNVMNKIKQRHPFVDLLKPETNAVFPVLLTLDPEVVRGAKDGLPVLTDLVRGQLKTRGILSMDATSMATVNQSVAAGVAVDRLLGGSLREGLAISASAAAVSAPAGDDLLRETEDNVMAGRGPAVSDTQGQLGWFDMVVDRIKGVDKKESLRRSLKDWLKSDASFQLDTHDETFTEIVKRVGSEVDFIVTGHTHLERAMPIQTGMNRYYYNTGTWVRVIKLTEAILDPEKFDQVWQALTAGTMAAIDDALVSGAPLLADQATVVKISADGTHTVGQMFHVFDSPTGVNLVPVPQSLFVR